MRKRSTDWHEIHDLRWEGKQLITFEDDASRLVAGYGVFDNATSVNAKTVLADAIKQYGRPASVITDNGKQFTSNVESLDCNKPVEFEEYLMKNHINHIHSRPYHPQTNGKIEKFWDIFECKIIHFKSIDEFIHWYNHIRPHGALDLDEMETPADAYYTKKVTNKILIDPEVLWRNHS